MTCQQGFSISSLFRLLAYMASIVFPLFALADDTYNDFVADVYLLESNQARIPQAIIRYTDDEVGPLLKKILNPKLAKEVMGISMRSKPDGFQLQLPVLMGPLLNRYAKPFNERPDLYEAEYLDCYEISVFMMAYSMKSLAAQQFALDRATTQNNEKILEVLKNMVPAVEGLGTTIAKAQAKTLRDQIDKHMFSPEGAQRAIEIIDSLNAAVLPGNKNKPPEPDIKNHPATETTLQKKYISSRIDEYRFAKYFDDWRQKVERVGSLNYPEAARGKLYGSLELNIEIKADGTLSKINIIRSSGYKVLDDGALRIIQMASPYQPFPPDIRRDTDVIVFTKTINFTQANQISTK